MGEEPDGTVPRRTVLEGIGGLAAVSMSGASAADVAESLAGGVPSDPHTLATYRSIVDAILPRTPELAGELGEEHVPGGLSVGLEKFLVWDFNHFQEIRLETLQTPAAAHSELEDTLGGLTAGDLESPLGSGDSPAGLVDPDRFELLLEPAVADTPLAAVLDLVDGVVLEGLVDRTGLERHLDFGDLERLEVGVADAPVAPDAEGPADVDLVVETATESAHRVVQNYPYAPVFPVVFDVLAAEFLAAGHNEDPPAPNERFAAGGTFVRLSRRDRLRCLWDVVDEGSVDRLDGLLSPLVPYAGILKFAVMAINGLIAFGYYTEWSGYGDTKTDTPAERELQLADAGDVLGRRQTGYPGPAPGYARDWYHRVDGGFTDDADLDGDLPGEDVLVGGGD